MQFGSEPCVNVGSDGPEILFHTNIVLANRCFTGNSCCYITSIFVAVLVIYKVFNVFIVSQFLVSDTTSSLRFNVKFYRDLH